MSNKLTKFITSYAIFLSILSLSTTILGYFSPSVIFPNLTSESSAVLYFYAARNFGIFVAFAYALHQKNKSMLLVLFILRFVVEAFDLFATLKFSLVNFNPAIITICWVLFFLIPEAVCIYYLHRSKKLLNK